LFSSRLDWSLPRNRITELLTEKRRAGAPVFDLTESNPTRAGLSYPEEEILGALSDPRSLRYEPDPAGMREARESIAAYYDSRGATVDAGEIVLTASTSEAYALLLKLLADPGDEILVPRPSYPLFSYLAALESARTVQYPLLYEDRWFIDLEALATAITKRTKAIFVVNPNNPTGSLLKHRELDALLDVCASRNLALVSDEVFSDYALAEDPECVRSLVAIEAAPSIFCLSGLSKIVGLPQMKLGWIVLGGSAKSDALERLELIADTYLSVGTPVQLAAGRLLETRSSVGTQILSRVRENLEELEEKLRTEPACRLLALDGGWYATVQVPSTRSDEEWAETLLAEKDVLVQPGYFFDFERGAFLILSLLTPRAIFGEGLRRIFDHLES
jgi:aspartate/methionine/tyrosine aminotransferase